MSRAAPCLRWTIGDVSRRGFEALRLSVWGANRLFGDAAHYAICCNSIALDEARARTAPLPPGVAWHAAERSLLPDWLRPHLGPGMAEGVAWKFAPPRLFPDGYELSLDNDCILWELPDAIRVWLDGAASGCCLLAEDVRPAFGRFAPLCGTEARNTGIRGLPPGFDLEAALRRVLDGMSEHILLTSELDEQGLQTAALSQENPPLVVRLEVVSICSPFWPHRAEPGRCGAHLVGLNSRHIAWDYHGRPADAWMREHWTRLLPLLRERTGAPRAATPVEE